MKKVKVLLLSISALTTVAVTFSIALSTQTDVVYLYNPNTGFCDIRMNATFVPNGVTLFTTYASDVWWNDYCVLREVYQPL